MLARSILCVASLPGDYQNYKGGYCLGLVREGGMGCYKCL